MPTSFTNTSPTSSSVPTGVPDPRNPGYDTAGYRLGTTMDASGTINIPNTVTGNISTVYTPQQTQAAQAANPSGNPFANYTTMTSGGGGDFGGPVAPYGGGPFSLPTPTGQYVVPPLPAALQTPFSLPTYDQFTTDNPQFETGLKTALQGAERSAAAQGSILGGGEQKAITKYATDYGSSHYQDYVNNLLAQRQNQFSEYLANAGLSSNAFGANQTAYQNQVANALSQFGTNYQQYLDLIGSNRNAQNDYWSHLMDVTRAGISSAAGVAPPPAS